MINIIISDKYINPLYYYNYIMVYIYDIITYILYNSYKHYKIVHTVR